jgi:hypothetical protein
MNIRLRTLLPNWRDSPLTLGYLCVLLTTYWLTIHLLPFENARPMLLAISTNIGNIEHHPVTALVGSALVPVPPLLSLPGALTVGVGIGICMAFLERTYGRWRAAATFLSGHLGATLLTVPVIEYGVAAHRYDPQELHGFDFGVSYGAVAAMSAITLHLPRWARPLWVMGGTSYLLSMAEWSDFLPDFTTVGHLLALAIGLAAAIGLHHRSAPSRNPSPGAGFPVPCSHERIPESHA